MSQDIGRYHMALVVTQGKYFKHYFYLYDILFNPHIWTLLALFPITSVLRESSSKKDITVNKVWEQTIPSRLNYVLSYSPPQISSDHV